MNINSKTKNAASSDLAKDTAPHATDIDIQLMLKKPQKRLFIGLMSFSWGIMTLFFLLIWKIGYLGLLDINEYLPGIFGIVLGIIVVLVALGIFSMVAAVKGWRMPMFFHVQTYALINALFPVSVCLGKLLGIHKRQVEAAFVSVSNAIISNRHIRVPADRLVVVTPHCLQLATCPHKITRDPHNCKRCGGCDIAALVNLADEMGFHFFVVTGGTLARQTIKKMRPKAVLAIACERDLTSGIQDVYPLPAVGVMNIRPNGPCFNTHVDIEEFRRQLEEIIEPKGEPNG